VISFITVFIDSIKTVSNLDGTLMEDAEDILESEGASGETESSSTQENTYENRDKVKTLQADVSLYFLKCST